MSFFENWLDREINYNEEIKNLEYLLNKLVYQNLNSLEYYLGNNFLKWKFRNNTTSLDDFKMKSGISSTIDLVNKGICINIDYFLDYIEFLYTLLGDLHNIIDNGHDVVKSIYQNLNSILEKINFKVIWIRRNGGEFAQCVEKDFKVRESVDIVKDENLAERIFMYRHRSNQGNLYEKAIILSRLFMYYEGIEKNLKSNNLTKMCDFIGTISDKLNVRHKPNNAEQLVIDGLSKEEIEKCYDKLFNTYLSAIILDDYYKDKKDLDTIKRLFEDKK